MRKSYRVQREKSFMYVNFPFMTKKATRHFRLRQASHFFALVVAYAIRIAGFVQVGQLSRIVKVKCLTSRKVEFCQPNFANESNVQLSMYG